jgi:uncharacterized protein
VPHPSDQLRLNVGFLLNQPVGSSRDFDFDIPVLHLDSDLDLHNLSGNAKFTRTAQGLLAQVSLQANIDADCVRCLTHAEQAQINLAPLVREYMLLEIPISPLCRPDCKGLCPICGENLNENMHHHEDEDTDPLLSGLKKLLDNE